MSALGVLVAFAVFLELVSATSLGVVKTEGGMVKGQNINLGVDRYMDIFKGIPFADNPGLYEKPKRHPGWDGVMDTMEYKHRCLQLTFSQLDVRGSTDCLYLNIWVPHNSTVSTNLPVMIWIFGGAFLFGSSKGNNLFDDDQYDGQEIANRGNVIVVTFEYRVGPLGFLSSGDSSLPGNYGLWDQQAAIAWVHRNIRSFGGDPDMITIFGESAGGASVNFQTLTPHNKGMIKRAISQSGVSLCPWAVNREPRKFAEEMAEKVNCPTNDTMVDCLKKTDPKLITMAGSIRLRNSPEEPIVSNVHLVATIDGDFLPDEPEKLFHNAAEIDYIAGTNSMDGHIFTSANGLRINSRLLSTPVDDVRTLLASYTEEKGQLGADEAYSMYTSDWGDNPETDVVKKTVVAIATDYLFFIPNQAALHLLTANATTGRTYSYLFSEQSRYAGTFLPYPFPIWVEADHAEDVEYVFGKPFSALLDSAQHRDLAGYMIAYWTNFAKTGDPNEGGLSVPCKWPRFTSDSQKYLEINHDTNENSVGQKMRESYVHLWRDVLPKLPTVVS